MNSKINADPRIEEINRVIHSLTNRLKPFTTSSNKSPNRGKLMHEFKLNKKNRITMFDLNSIIFTLEHLFTMDLSVNNSQMRQAYGDLKNLKNNIIKILKGYVKNSKNENAEIDVLPTVVQLLNALIRYLQSYKEMLTNWIRMEIKMKEEKKILNIIKRTVKTF